MGLEQSVRFPAAPPAWTAVSGALAARGLAFQVCMIDGELAFPDEHPPETWSELRLRTPQGMITVRRDANRIAFVTWGNVDAELLEQRNTLMRAFAETGGGTIEPAAT